MAISYVDTALLLVDYGLRSEFGVHPVDDDSLSGIGAEMALAMVLFAG